MPPPVEMEGQRRQKRHSSGGDRYNGEGVTGPCPTLNNKHPVAQHSRGEKIPHTRSVRPPRLPQASSDSPCPQPAGATLPARALGLSSLPGHRADVLGRQLGEECPPCHRSPVCKPEVGQGVTGRPQGPGRQGSCCPAPRAVPALSGAAGPAPTSSAEQREARAVTWAQGAGRWPGVGPLPSQLWGRALCSWCCAVPWCRGRREAGRPGWGAYRGGAGRENVITRSSLLKVRHRLAGTEVT